MLGWFRGASAEPQPNGAAVTSTSTSTAASAENKPKDAATAADESEWEYEYDDNIEPQTPAAMFAVKAFRTAIFGTPVPKPRQPVRRRKKKPTSQENPQNKPEQKPTFRDGGGRRAQAAEIPRQRQTAATAAAAALERREQQSKQQSSLEPVEEPTKPIPFRMTKKRNLFDADPAESAPLSLSTGGGLMGAPAKQSVAPSSPTKGILMTPGGNLGRNKKAVSFDPAIPEAATETQGGRIRSGIPNDCPGKFPSPWTPRTGAPGMKKTVNTSSLEETSKPAEPPKRKTSVNIEVSENTRIQEILEESDRENGFPMINDAELTTDINVPRSASGQYWKEHATNVEGLALSKVERLRERVQIATTYATKKDELCVNLGERLREVMDKNQKLKNELRRIQQLPSSPTSLDDTDLADALRVIAEKDARISADAEEMMRMQKVIEQYQSRMRSFEEMLDTREDKITELSMSLYTGSDGDQQEVIDQLRTKLRKSRQEVRELAPLKSQLRDVKAEKDQLETLFLQGSHNHNDSFPPATSTTASRASLRTATETRLRTEIDELEKTNRELRLQMRAKSSSAAKERREVEKQLRGELSDVRTALRMAELDREGLAREVDRIQRSLGKLEREKAVQADMDRLAAAAGDEMEWQKRQRELLRELRRAKEEVEALRAQKAEADDAARRARGEVRALKSAAENQELPGSDDSAIDRSYDLAGKAPAGQNSFAVPSSPFSPQPRGTPGPNTNSKNAKPAAGNNGDGDGDLYLLPDLPDDTPAKPRATTSSANGNTNPSTSKAPAPAPVPQDDEDGFEDVPDVDAEHQNSRFTSHHRRPTRPSPRPSMVTFATTPPRRFGRFGAGGGVGGVGGARAAAVGKKVFADPARQAAAEKRLAERKRARLAGRVVA